VPGFYDVRFFLGGTPSETRKTAPVLVGPHVAVTAVFEGRRIKVTWTREAQSPKDWMALFRTSTRSNKKFLTYQYAVAAASDGPLIFVAPREPGSYEVRYFRADSGYVYSGKSDPIIVPLSDHMRVLALGPPRARVEWECNSQEPGSRDWVGLFDGSAPAANRLTYAYCSEGRHADGFHGVVELDVSKFLTPSEEAASQQWELRFFSTALPKEKQPHVRIPFKL
jgi:hypothetical protein